MLGRVGLIGSLLLAGCYSGSGSNAEGWDGETDPPDSEGTDGSGPSGGSNPSGPSSGTSATDSTTGPTSGPSSGPTASASASESDTDDTAPVDATLLERLQVIDLNVPAGVEAGVNNWRVWANDPLVIAPTFTAPLANCETLIGYTSNSGGSITASVAHVGGDLLGVMEIGPGRELRGLVAEDDDHFGALLWDRAAQRIFVSRFDLTGAEEWSTELTNPDNTPTDFGIGDSRLEWGGGSYGAYYHVHSDSGHEGDTLKWVSNAGGETTEWGWGCSHSMSNVLRWNDALATFMPACVTDCFPGTSGDFSTQSIGGIYVNHSAGKILDVDAGCNGSVAGELGSAAIAPAGWKVVFNAHQAPATLGQSSYNPGTMNQDIGFASVAGDFTPGGVVWLTDTPSVDEDDASIAAWTPGGDETEQYVVGWHEAGTWHLARIDAAAAVLEGPVDVTTLAQWGKRDDPFRRHQNADVVWSWFDTPGSTTLHMARLDAGAPNNCAEF